MLFLCKDTCVIIKSNILLVKFCINKKLRKFTAIKTKIPEQPAVELQSAVGSDIFRTGVVESVTVMVVVCT